MMLTKQYGVRSAEYELPTGSYLTEHQLSQAANIYILQNEFFYSLPTHPHVRKIWKINVKGHSIYWTTPDTVFKETSLLNYYKDILKFMLTNVFIEPKDLYPFKYGKLYAKYDKVITGLSIPIHQQSLFLDILQRLSKVITTSVSELEICFSADNELSIVKEENSGTHYILVGEEDDDVSYMFISNTPGTYFSLHKDEKNSLNKIIQQFITA